MEKDPIMMGDTRILRPAEFDLLLKGARKECNQILLKTMLFTGMRYIELQEFQKNPKWFQGSFIVIPVGNQRKVHQRLKWRHVRITPRAQEIIPVFLKGKPLPSRVAWIKALHRWASRVGIDSDGLNVKTTRKTWESWTTFYYRKLPNALLFIVQSQGHTQITALQHYLSTSFVDEDEMLMKPYVEGFL